MHIIFHIPFPLESRDLPAPMRPVRMLDAFLNIGLTVDVISGYSKDRRIAIRKIKSKIRNGVKYDFLYSESSTIPTLLTDNHHLPLNFRLDFRFFAFLKKKKIPLSLFLRDIYWLFPVYSQARSWLRIAIGKSFLLYDLKQYNKYLTRLYLPSLEMSEYLPYCNENLIQALPPGHNVDEKLSKNELVNGKLNLIYVGGIGSHYQMHTLLKVLVDFPLIELKICVREKEWENIEKEYLYPLPPNISVLHKNAAELRFDYQNSDISMLFLFTQDYRKFAMPVKLFEYIGYGKPVIATSGSAAGSFVSENDIGWTINYDEEELKTLFDLLLESPELIKEKTANCKKIAPEHTWEKRAQKVIDDLANC